tara:strand:- start:70 stop:261 length:192 start_codon:yes stop_codon:yes gene_type:complete
MDNTVVPTHKMIQKLTDYIVDGMTLDELRQFVYDDVYSSMLEEEELFHLNMEQLELDLEDLGF